MSLTVSTHRKCIMTIIHLWALFLGIVPPQSPEIERNCTANENNPTPSLVV